MASAAVLDGNVAASWRDWARLRETSRPVLWSEAGSDGAGFARAKNARRLEQP